MTAAGSMAADWVVGLIRVYQRRVSPWKGYCCAHRVVHGGRSCSEHGVRVARRAGVMRFWPLMRRRFERCAEAGKSLRHHPQPMYPPGSDAAPCGLDSMAGECPGACLGALGDAVLDGLLNAICSGW